MSRREFIQRSGLTGAAIALAGRTALAGAPALKASARRKPNILFIMSDDHTTQAIGAYGSRLAKLNPTPNIDALAKGGMRFDRVFCNNSICTPSRASIITGQYSQTNGIIVLSGQIPPKRQYPAIEMKNEYANPACAKTIAEMKVHLKKTRKELGETDAKYPEIQKIIDGNW